MVRHFQNTLSGPALLHNLVCDMILGMEKKEEKCVDDKLLGLIGVLSGASILHEACKARADSALLDSNTDMKENYP